MSEKEMQFTDIQLPWLRMWWLSLPGADVRWEKNFAISLDPVGGPDPDAEIVIGPADKPLPKDYVQVWKIELTPVDTFSRDNVLIQFFTRYNGADTPYQPESKIQATVDPNVTFDRMHSWDILLKDKEQLVIRFTNFGAGIAGYDGRIDGRILREKN